MLHHRTTDPGVRAEHIADHAEREAYARACRKFGLNVFSHFNSCAFWKQTFQEALRELAGELPDSPAS